MLAIATGLVLARLLAVELLERDLRPVLLEVLLRAAPAASSSPRCR